MNITFFFFFALTALARVTCHGFLARNCAKWNTFGIKGSDGIACLWESTIKANRSSYPRFRPRYSLLILPYICICHGPLTQIIQRLSNRFPTGKLLYSADMSKYDGIWADYLDLAASNNWIATGIPQPIEY